MQKLTLSQWSDLAQVVSAIAVVASLVYVGFEIHRNTEASRAATRQSIAETDFVYVAATLDPVRLVEALLTPWSRCGLGLLQPWSSVGAYC